MSDWTVRVLAIKAFMGNPDEPVYWHFSTTASSAESAIAMVRWGLPPGVPRDAEITAFPRMLPLLPDHLIPQGGWGDFA